MIAFYAAWIILLLGSVDMSTESDKRGEKTQKFKNDKDLRNLADFICYFYSNAIFRPVPSKTID